MSKFHLRILLSVTCSLVIHGLLLFIISMHGIAQKSHRGGYEIKAQLKLPPAVAQSNSTELKPLLTADRESVVPTELFRPEKRREENKQQVNDALVVASAVDVTTTSSPDGAASGVGITRAIALPWLMGLQVRSPEANQPTVNYRAIMEARSREGLKKDAQLIEQQIYRLLISRMKNQKDATGNCVLEEANSLMQLVCDSAWLKKALHDDEKSLIDLFQSLRQKAREVAGFSIELRQGQAIIVLNTGSSSDGD